MNVERGQRGARGRYGGHADVLPGAWQDYLLLEAALHQEVGGPEVMEGQFGLLAGVSGDSGVITVQILPFSSGAHAASGVGSLASHEFPEAPRVGHSAWKT